MFVIDMQALEMRVPHFHAVRGENGGNIGVRVVFADNVRDDEKAHLATLVFIALVFGIETKSLDRIDDFERMMRLSDVERERSGLVWHTYLCGK